MRKHRTWQFYTAVCVLGVALLGLAVAFALHSDISLQAILTAAP